MSSKKSAIPENHPIHKVWDNNKKLRTTAGTIDLAKNGDKDALHTLMGEFILWQENKNLRIDKKTLPDDELTAWIAECFLAWIPGNTISLDEAFGISGKKKGRRNLNNKELTDRVRICSYFADRLKEYQETGTDLKGTPYENAKTDTHKKFNISESKAEKIYLEYK